MNTTCQYRPARFFLLAFAISWIAWFAAAWCSNQKGMEAAMIIALFFVGGFGPFIAALVMTWTSGSKALKRDFLSRLVDPRRFSLLYLPVTILLVPALFYVSVVISEHVGGPRGQWTLVPNIAGALPLAIIAPTLEELGWRGYGVDALRAKYGALATALLFGVLWSLWHAPLLFVNHAYHHDLLLMGPLYWGNFFISVVPIAVIANWLYYKHNRLILAAIILHFIADIIPMGLAIQPFTKIFTTGVFIVAALAVVLLDRKAFSEGPKTFIPEDTVYTNGPET